MAKDAWAGLMISHASPWTSHWLILAAVPEVLLWDCLELLHRTWLSVLINWKDWSLMVFVAFGRFRNQKVSNPVKELNVTFDNLPHGQPLAYCCRLQRTLPQNSIWANFSLVNIINLRKRNDMSHSTFVANVTNLIKNTCWGRYREMYFIILNIFDLSHLWD